MDTEGYDIVVFDTAPTGHTLRMLEVPRFLGDFIDRILSIRKSVGSVLGMVGMSAFAGSVDTALDEAEAGMVMGPRVARPLPGMPRVFPHAPLGRAPWEL